MSYRSDVLAATTAAEQAHRQLQRARQNAHTPEQRERVTRLIRRAARLAADLEHEAHQLRGEANR